MNNAEIERMAEIFRQASMSVPSRFSHFQLDLAGIQAAVESLSEEDRRLLIQSAEDAHHAHVLECWSNYSEFPEAVQDNSREVEVAGLRGSWLPTRNLGAASRVPVKSGRTLRVLPRSGRILKRNYVIAASAVGPFLVMAIFGVGSAAGVLGGGSDPAPAESPSVLAPGPASAGRSQHRAPIVDPGGSWAGEVASPLVSPEPRADSTASSTPWESVQPGQAPTEGDTQVALVPSGSVSPAPAKASSSPVPTSDKPRSDPASTVPSTEGLDSTGPSTGRTSR
jgi:hypothetical protein